MPTISALDPSIRYDDADQEAAAQRAQQRDQMMRAWMQNQQVNAQRGMQQEDMTARERMFNAELADRGAGRQYNGGLQMNMLEMGQKPQMAQLDFQKQAYNDARGDTAGTRDFSNLQAQYKTQMLRDAIGGGRSGGEQTANDAIRAGFQITDPEGYAVKQFDSGATPGQGHGGVTDQDKRALMFGLLGLNAPRDVNMENQDFIRQIIKAKMASDPNADFGQYGKALQSGDLAAIPQRPQETIPLEDLQRSLEAGAKSFGEKDAAVFGGDPTEEDVQGFVKQRDQTAQAIRARNPRMTPEQAVERANFIIEQQVAPNAGRMGTGWIQRLREALGIRAAQPAAAPVDTGLDMGQWQG